MAQTFQAGNLLNHDYVEMPKIRVSEPPQLTYGTTDVERALHARMQGDLSFKGQQTSYASHNTHAFAARFPPQLPKTFIEELTEAGERVLDPMAGSGTALVEAAIAGRVGIGADIDPLAVRIARAKVTPLEADRVLLLAEQIADYAELLTTQNGHEYREGVLASLERADRDFVEYWFEPSTIAQLTALVEAIRRFSPPSYRSFFEMLFSSIIVTKSGGVSLARDLAHTRPHKVGDKKIKDAIRTFAERA